MFGLTYHLRAAINLLVLVSSLVLWAVPAHLPPLLRMLLPFRGWKRFWTDMAERIFSSWLGFIVYSIRTLLGITAVFLSPWITLTRNSKWSSSVKTRESG